MNVKKIISVALVIVGCFMLGGSYYIKKEIREGQLQIDSAKSTVKTGTKIFSLSPVTEPIGSGIARAADKKIRSGEEQIAYYTKVANFLLVGGLVLVGGGVFLFFTERKRK